nr:cytosine permease [Pseudomaricurvus alkylphenolicus]
MKNLLDEPTDQPVDQERSVSWKNIALIKIGVFISLPGFVTGVKVGNQIGLEASVYVFFIAGIVLGAFASICGSVGARTKLSTYYITQYAFGSRGAHLVNSIFAASLFGWFGINLVLFGKALVDVIGDSALGPFTWEILTIAGAILMISTVIFGFRALDRLSQFAVPLLILSLVVLVYASITQFGLENAAGSADSSSMSAGKAISAVIGGSIVGTVIFPDICRYAISVKHGIIAAIITFSIAKPLITLSSAIPSLATGEREIMAILDALNLGMIALVIVVFTTWTSNNGNLYGASLGLSTIFKGRRYWQLALGSGVVGTLLALSGVMDDILPFLHLLGIAIPPVAGIYIADFYILNGGKYRPFSHSTMAGIRYPSIVAWSLACAAGYASLNDLYVLTTVPALDSVIVAASVLCVLDRILIYVCGNRYADAKKS